jgi:exportin-5
MVFLRLTEDVLTLQTAPVQRRRDILQALTVLMPRLFPCFVRTLNSSFESLQDKDWQSSAIFSRLLLSVLELLTTLADWVHISIIMDQNGLLLQLLCRIIGGANDLSVQMSAVDCLLVISSRKVCDCWLNESFALIMYPSLNRYFCLTL